MVFPFETSCVSIKMSKTKVLRPDDCAVLQTYKAAGSFIRSAIEFTLFLTICHRFCLSIRRRCIILEPQPQVRTSFIFD